MPGATAPARGDRPGDRRTKDAAEKLADDVKAGQEVRLCLRQVARRYEVEGDRIRRTGDHGRVIAEEQTAERGGNRQRNHKSIIGFRHAPVPLPRADLRPQFPRPDRIVCGLLAISLLITLTFRKRMASGCDAGSCYRCPGTSV